MKTMVDNNMYSDYFGAPAPSNLERLETISLATLRSIMTDNIPTEKSLLYKVFLNALMEQMNYFDMNSDLIDSSGSGGYTLGSYKEEGTNHTENNSKSISRVSPIAYDILLSNGLLYSGIGRCDCG